MKAVLALEEVDFKRHKDAVAYFNKTYVATDIFPREIGKKLGIGLSVIFTVFWLIPYIYVICCSFKPGSEVIAVPPSFFPKAFSIENFTGLLERMDALQFLWNSLSVSLISTVIALILGSLAAYAIQRSGAKLSIILVVLVLCLKMIPTSSIVVPIYELICMIQKLL